MTTIYLFQSTDEGEIEIANSTLRMTDGPESLVYLSLFGGEIDDPGESDLSEQWWGNELAKNEYQRYRSRTQYLLRSIPQTTGNLRRIKAAAEYDLAWTLTAGIFETLEVIVTIPRLNWVTIAINTSGGNFGYTVQWEYLS